MKKLFSIYDDAVKRYNAPFAAVTVGEAMRILEETLLSSRDSLLFRHPNDYHLYFIGDFDDENGTVVSEQHPQPVISVSQALASIHERELKNLSRQKDLTMPMDDNGNIAVGYSEAG